MPTAPKCKVCKSNHGPGAPHVFAGAEAPKAAVRLSPKSKAPADAVDMTVAQLKARIVELEAERDQAAAGAYRIYMRNVMRKRRAAAKERAQ